MTEEQRLGGVYAGFTDGQLVELARDAGNLTPVAHAALTAEAATRGLRLPGVSVSEDVLRGSDPLSGTGVPDHAAFGHAGTDRAGTDRADAFGVGVPGFFPGAGPAVEQALDPAGEVRAGMTGLVTLYDGLELSRACQALADAGVEPAIEELAGDQATGSATRYEIWVSTAQVVASQKILRERLGLFPDGEFEGEDEPAGDGTVGQFESENEAGEMQKALADAGIPAQLQREQGTWLLRVEPVHQEKALAVLAAQLDALG